MSPFVFKLSMTISCDLSWISSHIHMITSHPHVSFGEPAKLSPSHECTEQKALFYHKGNMAAAVLWTVDNLAASAFVDLCS